MEVGEVLKLRSVDAGKNGRTAKGGIYPRCFRYAVRLEVYERRFCEKK